jgi:hypothetical protein
MSNMLTQGKENGLSEIAKANLQAAEDELEQNTPYFRPKDGKSYLLMLDPEEKMQVTLNDKFKDAHGRPVKRYSFRVTHVNTGKIQQWDCSKTVSSQILGELKKGFKVLQVQRFGADRSTVYKVQGVE